MDALTAIRTRRSYGRLSEPAPSRADLETILHAGAAAPDHGDLRPFRFTVLREAGIDAFGRVLEEAYRLRCAETSEPVHPAKAQKERTKLHRAPLVIIVSAVRNDSVRIPWSDQRDAAVAAAENILIAAHALGYGGMWRTGGSCEDRHVKSALNMSSDDAIVAFIYIGTRAGVQKEPRAVDLEDLVSEFSM